MKFFQVYLVSLTIILLFSCGAQNGQKANNEAETAAIEREVKTIDSLSQELENTFNEIDQSADALEETVKELEDLNQ